MSKLIENVNLDVKAIAVSSYYTEVLVGKVDGVAIDLKSTVLYKLVKYGKTEWAINIDSFVPELPFIGAVLNTLLGKTGKVVEVCQALKDKRPAYCNVVPYVVMEKNVRIKGVRYSNSLNQLHIYVSINNVESAFLRFYVLDGKLYWLLNKRRFMSQYKITRVDNSGSFIEDVASTCVSSSSGDAVKQALAELRACPKVGDASRFVDDPKKEHFPNSIVGYVPKTKGEANDFNHYLGHRFVCIKGGLVCKDYYNFKDSLKYARRYHTNVYYTGDIAVEDMIACKGDLTVAMFMSIKPMFRYDEEGGKIRL